MNMLDKAVIDKTIMLTVINNPFDPKQHTRSNPEASKNAVVATFVPAMMQSVVVSLNGAIIEGEAINTARVKPGDSVVVCPIPHGGGGGGKNIFRMVAMIAIAVFAPAAAAMLPGASTALGIGSLTMGSIYTMGIVMVGSMLVNALLPPSMPKKDNYNQSFEESRTYGIDGAKNTSSEDTVVPIVYGKHRVAGNRIAAYVKNVGDTQDVYMLFNAGEGPIAGLSDIRINDQPAENFQGFQSQQRIGSATQTPMNWFQDNIVPVSRNINLSPTFSTYLTSGEVDKLRIDLVAPAGIAFYNDQGGTDHRNVNIEIQYRRAGSTGWTNMPNANARTGTTQGYYYTDTEIETTTLRSGTTLSGDTIIQTSTGRVVGVRQAIPVYSTSHVIGGKGRQPIRKSFESPKLLEGVYEVRVRRTSAESVESNLINGVTWSEVSEIVTDKVAYRHTALLGVLVTLSDQLSSIPNISFLHHGKLVRVRRMDGANEVWTYEASSNPAWVSYDILTNKRYGGAIPESRIDLIQWQEWADFCEENGLRFNGVFDTQNNVWDSLQHVFRVGHAQIVNQGTRYTVAIERADTPVMMFNSSNMVEKSFKLNWLPKSDRANEVEITFWNEENDFKRQMIKVRDPDVGPNDVVRTARLTLFGVTNPEQAKMEAVFQLNLNRHILRTVEFEASIDAIACTVGSQILIQHEMPNWGEGGRADPGSTAAIIRLDREIDVFAGLNYRVLVAFDAIQRASGTVSGISGNVVWLNGYNGRTDIKRAVINGVDREIRRVVNDGSGTHGLELADTSSIFVNQAYQLFDTDVIEERTVTNAPGKHTQLSVSVPFSAAPAHRTKWMFGRVETIKRPFRVLAISGSGEYERSIKAIEYKDEVYEFQLDQIIPVVEPVVSISHVRNVTTDCTWFKSGNTYAPVADIGWGMPLQGYYGGADVYMAKNGGSFQRIYQAGAQELQYSYVGLSVGDTATFKVVARDIIGQQANINSAPTAPFIALARPLTGTPTNLMVTTSGGSYILTWNNPTEPFRNIEIYRSITDDYATASRIDSVSGQSYTDANAPLGVQVFYWVRTINADGLRGEWNNESGSTAPIPGQVSDLQLVGSFTGTSLTAKWVGVKEARDYVVEVSANGLLSRATVTTETQFKYTIEDAISDNNVGRAITLTVKPRLQSGDMGAGVSLVATNPQIATSPANLLLGTTGDHVTVNFDVKTESDLQGYKIWASKTQGFTPSPLNLILDGKNNGGIFPVEAGEQWYVVVGAYDVWGSDGMVLSGEATVTATSSADIASQLTDTIDRSHLAAVLRGELDALDNQWTMKVQQTTSDGTPYIAGIGLAVENGENGALSSQMLIAADTFAIMPSATSTAADSTLPFIVSNGQVFIQQAFIEDGSITNAKIGNVIQSDNYSPTSGWKIDKTGTAEFSNIIIRDSAGNVILSSGEGVVGGGGGSVNPDDFGAMAFLDQITAGNVSTYIASAALGSAYIQDGAITNAKIGNSIQSDNFETGLSGWYVGKSGHAEFNSGTFRGTLNIKSAQSGARVEMTNQVIKVFDANNVLRVKLGNLNA